MDKVIITGGSGLVGQHLCKILIEEGYDVALLSRRPNGGNESGIASYHWNPDKNEIDPAALRSCDYIIHLAGENIGKKRWTVRRKQQIIDSRIKSAELLYQNLSAQNHTLKAFISSSAIGYYGAVSSEKIFDENDSYAPDFLGTTCNQWERSADKFAAFTSRVVKLRTGIVLSNKGGVIPRLNLPVRWGLGSAIGGGKQYLPWIHIDDLCGLYLEALVNKKMKGVYNAVAPMHISNKELIRKIAKQVHRPFWLPGIPSFIIKMIFGEMSAMLLHGSRISSKKIEAEGFTFRFPSIDIALRDLYK